MNLHNFKPFKPVEHWVSALMSLPEANFFELLRSIFGNIKTPFNKQRLLEDLIALLSKSEIHKTIASYINEQDHKVIAAVAMLDKPSMKDMEAFFSGELGSAELHALLINLEERLILYRFHDNGNLLLALNPVLSQVLAPFVADTHLVFPSAPVDRRPPPGRVAAFIKDHRIMAALFAFIFHEEEVFKREELFKTEAEAALGTSVLPEIRKKVLDYGKKNFPVLDFDLLVRTLVQLGLFRPEARCLILNQEKAEGFSGLSPIERQEYWTAGVYLCLLETAPEQPSSGNSFEDQPFRLSGHRLRSISSLIHRFRLLIEGDRKYPEITLLRLWTLLGKETGNHELIWELFLSAMEKTGLMHKKENFWYVPIEGKEKTDTKQPSIAMDSAFSIVLYPEISFADAISLGAFCSVKEIAGTLVRLELSRQSVVKGLDLGMEASDMLTLLDRLSGNRIDESLGWTLKEWEARYKSVSLYQGIVLTLAEEHHYLASAGPVSCLIQKTLAPGVYLLSSGEREEAINILHRAGIDIVAQPPNAIASSKTRQGGFSNRFARTSFPRLASPIEPEPPAVFPDSTGFLPKDSLASAKASSEATSIKENFRRVLEKKKLSKQEREELLARIERRIILTESQLEGTSLRYEKLEAKGLDYTGKSVIARQAIEAGSLLEVTWPTSNGELNCVLGVPQTLEKKEGDSVLVLRTHGNAASIPGNTVRIPLGKISLLRRIKQSIFEE